MYNCAVLAISCRAFFGVQIMRNKDVLQHKKGPKCVRWSSAMDKTPSKDVLVYFCKCVECKGLKNASRWFCILGFPIKQTRTAIRS